MQPSARLVRAVAAERAELERHRARLAEEAGDLRAALERIEHGLAEIDERCGLLDRLAPPGDGTERQTRGVAAGGEVRAEPRGAAAGGEARAARRGVAAGGERRNAAGDGDERAPLRGPAIREAAVRALVASGGDALHYREWFSLLAEAGHEVAGKDPLAVFLTQLSRSPVVRKGARAGVYELDPDAAARLTANLEDLHEDLRELTTGTDLAAIRARRAQLTAEIGRTERALEEVARVLAPARPLAAAG